MCCPTGVCAPAIHPALPRFAADLDWLTQQGVRVTRYNLAQQPQAFVDDAAVRARLDASGEGCLPLIVVDGEIASEGRYPERADLAAMAGVQAAVADTAPATSGCCGSSCC